MRRSLLLGLISISVLGPVAVADAAPTLVAGGLDNPRGIDVDRNGFVYIAEAGRGGSGPCVIGGEGERQCVGRTGAITRIGRGTRHRIVQNQPSLAGEGGFGAAGPQDVDVRQTGFKSFVTGLGGDPADRRSLGGAGAGLGKLFAFVPFGRVVAQADLTAYESLQDPDKNVPGSDGIDSNPTSVFRLAATPTDDFSHVVVDAGGNDLLRVRGNGQISTLAVFPSRFVAAPPFLGLPPGTKIPMQSVPTAVAQGSDGAFYVSELTGFPFPVGAANIYRVVPGSAPRVFASGLTNVTDLAFDRDGSLLVVKTAKNGLLAGDGISEVVRIARNGAKTSFASAGLTAAYGIAVGPNNEVYVTNKSTQAGSGELLRLR